MNDAKQTPLVPSGNLPPVPSQFVNLDHARLQRGIVYYLTLGVRGLLGSKKGSAFLLVTTIMSVALFMGKLSPETFIAGLTIASGIYTTSSAAVDIKNNSAPND